MNAENVATIEVKLHFNLALLLHQSQCILERYNMDVSMFTDQQLVDAWAEAIQHGLESWARDTDHFLQHNGRGEKFLNALLET